MLNMVAKYTQDLKPHKASASAPTNDVILITGSTGAIGSNVLAELAGSSQVAKIYAITRKLATSSLERQREALKSRGLDATLVDGLRVAVVDGDLCKPDLGLSPEMYNEVGIFHLNIATILVLIFVLDSLHRDTYNSHR